MIVKSPFSEETVGGINLPSTVIPKKKLQERPGPGLMMMPATSRLRRNTTIPPAHWVRHWTPSIIPTAEILLGVIFRRVTTAALSIAIPMAIRY